MAAARGRRAGFVAGVLVLASVLGVRGFLRRSLPQIDGKVRVAGLQGPVTIVRDVWGVPHVFAGSDADAYFGLGFAVAQDRLFQLELLRHVGQGRLAELFGPDLLPVDRLFRTLDLQGIGRRRLAAARPEVRAAVEAYCRGINAGAAQKPLPVEFTLLGRTFAPVDAETFVGITGYMTWDLQIAWPMEPLFERLVAKVGEARAAELFPYDDGGTPSVYPAPPPAPALTELTPRARAVLAALPRFCASNNWVVAPSRSRSGHALLANDPHLGHGLPGTWYEAHLSSPTMDVAGFTLPGVPFIVIGHNPDVAWGFTNVMLDSADFFVEERRGEEVRYRGDWVALETRREVLAVKGGEPETLEVRETPHGPLVSALLAGESRALSFRWTHATADHTNDYDGFYDLNRATDWASFRAAVARFGAISQNVAYADRAGHIGMQTTGAIPRRKGRLHGGRFRNGADGSEEWDGFHPFESNPSAFDPAEGFLASANNATVPAPGPFHISSQWEPPDRYLRIREVLAAQPKVDLDDLAALQGDVVAVSARELLPRLRAAFATASADPRAARALALLDGWDGAMAADSPAAALFAATYKHLFHVMADDEMGREIADGYRAKGNLSAIMIRAAFEGGAASWLDDTRTPAIEGADEALRAAFLAAVAELEEALGGDPAGWRWGRLHTLELKHPLGSVRLLRPYFNRGPFAVPGHALTVNKGESLDDYKVTLGPSMRFLVEMGETVSARITIPAGQSGIPASPHYDDRIPLWRGGKYHPLLMARADAEARAEGILTLEVAP